MSWKIKFPKWKSFEGQGTIKLNKQLQGFPGTVSVVEGQLLEQAGLPAYRVSFARLHVNGGYYHYLAQNEVIDDKMMARYTPKGQKIGDLYKSDGAVGDDGPTGRGDWNPLKPNAACPQYDVNARYDATWPRVTYGYRGSAAIKKLIDDLDAAAKQGTVSDAVRAWFDANWDVDSLAKTFAVRNFAGAWDDTVHNVFPYKAAPDGKWVLVQQDFEWDFGLGSIGSQQGIAPWQPAETLYLGAYPSTPVGKTCELTSPAGCNAVGFSRLKDLFIQNYRTKYDDTLRTLSKTVLGEENVLKAIEAAVATFSKDDWNASPASKVFCGATGATICDVDMAHEVMRRWTRNRAAVVKTRLGM